MLKYQNRICLHNGESAIPINSSQVIVSLGCRSMLINDQVQATQCQIIKTKRHALRMPFKRLYCLKDTSNLFIKWTILKIHINLTNLNGTTIHNGFSITGIPRAKFSGQMPIKSKTNPLW